MSGAQQLTRESSCVVDADLLPLCYNQDLLGGDASSLNHSHLPSRCIWMQPLQKLYGGSELSRCW